MSESVCQQCYDVPIDGILEDVGVGEVCWFRAWDMHVEYSQSMAGTGVLTAGRLPA
jgi:hypothetical protein